MTTTTEITGLVGAGVDRVDGPAKVTGEARYPADFGFENLAYAVLVQSTIAAGRIRRIDTAAAEAAPGVLAVITHRNAPRLARAPGGLGIGPPPPLQHDRIVHHGQHIAMVVARTLEQATAAARLIQIEYEETEPLLDIDDPRAKQVENAAGRDVSRGDVEAGLAAAEVVVAATYTTPNQTNNPLGLFATTAYWDGDLLTVHDSTQGTAFARASLAATFGIGESGVRVLAGPGTYTVMTQVAADVLGLPLERVRLELGDSAMPRAPLQGGSGLTAALGSAVHAACNELVRSFTELAGSPPAADTYTGMLARHRLTELSADGASARRTDLDAEPGIFAAKFAEVRVDPDLAEVRVTRFVAAVDGGRILNEKTAASQIIGGTAGGIGMALLEQTLSDPGTGRIANATFGDYLVAVNADVPHIDVIFTGEPDPINPVGVKGIGEVAIVGVAPAIANAVFHATGRRPRALPITAEQLL